MKSITEMYNILEQSLTNRRFKHSLGVAQTAKELAELSGYDSHKAYIAGLVHDCAKDLSYQVLIDKAREYHLDLDQLTLKSGALLHGPVGAEMAKRDFGIDDDDIISSIYFHTTAKENMKLLEKIIYISDFIEPNRNYDGVNKLREVSYKNLEEGLLQALSNTITFVVSMNAPLHIRTIEARNYILLQRLE